MLEACESALCANRASSISINTLGFLTSGLDTLGPFTLALDQRKFLIVKFDYFTKWIEVQVVSKITEERVCRFYWQKIQYRFSLLGVIVSNNGTRFSSASVIEYCIEIGVQTKFVSIVYPQEKRQRELENKLILKGIKKKPDEAKGLQAEQLHDVLWL